MARGDKSKHTAKQDRMAEHIEAGYEHRGVAKKEAKRRAWATVNAETGAGKKSGAGQGGKASPARQKARRSASSKKATPMRKRGGR